MRTEHSFLCHFGNIEIAQLNDSCLSEEQVCTLDVSVADFEVVERLEASYNLDEVMPDLLFCEQLPVSLFRSDNLQDVTAISVLHHNAQAVGLILEKSFFVTNYIRVIDACEDSDFVECVFFFFATELLHLHFFHGVNCVVGLANHLVNFAK